MADLQEIQELQVKEEEEKAERKAKQSKHKQATVSTQNLTCFTELLGKVNLNLRVTLLKGQGR